MPMWHSLEKWKSTKIWLHMDSIIMLKCNCTCLWTASSSRACRIIPVAIFNNNVFCRNSTSLWNLRALFQHLWKSMLWLITTHKYQYLLYHGLHCHIHSIKFLSRALKVSSKVKSLTKVFNFNIRVAHITLARNTNIWTNTRSLNIPCWQEQTQELGHHFSASPYNLLFLSILAHNSLSLVYNSHKLWRLLMNL